MKLPTPFYADDLVTLYHGDALELLPRLPRSDAIVTDPPYGVTHLKWDRWQDGWPSIAADRTDQLWCFGSFRMFWAHVADFAMWSIGQDIVWEKHNGSNSISDKFRRVHEHAVHFFRGDWKALYKQPQMTNDATARQVRRKRPPTQWGNVKPHTYVSEDGGPRLATSVLYVRSCHGHAVNETQKPEGVVAPLVAYSVPPSGLVIDPFAGSGTTLLVARRTGRRAIGIEIRREQCEHAVERLAQRDLDFEVAP